VIKIVLRVVYISLAVLDLYRCSVWQCLICTNVALFWFHNSTGLAT